jgi:hypothetical protein
MSDLAMHRIRTALITQALKKNVTERPNAASFDSITTVSKTSPHHDNSISIFSQPHNSIINLSSLSLPNISSILLPPNQRRHNSIRRNSHMSLLVPSSPDLIPPTLHANSLNNLALSILSSAVPPGEIGTCGESLVNVYIYPRISGGTVLYARG